MDIIADLHIHGKYSRGCSTDLNITSLEKYAKLKGLSLLGTGDFTHPKWMEEIKSNLTEEKGILKTKNGFSFLLQTEISLIYTQDGKGRRVHNIILAPSLEVVKQINEALSKKGRLDYDGRPIFKIPCPELVEMMRQISEDIEVIPAHAWTPWFSIFGSNSGFNSVEEAFQDRAKYVHAIETGLSSNPLMNWRLSKLDKYNLVSFSDSHSYWPWRIGREATMFDTELSYKSILKAIRTGEGLKGTIEINPYFGKYHLTGHRACGICLEPKESIKLNNICPKCKSKLTVGVLQRVEELADRPNGFKPKNAKEFKILIPLSEVLAQVMKKGVATQAVWKEYNALVSNFGSEFKVLLNATYDDLKKVTNETITEAIIKNRENNIKIEPGYDGVYGKLLRPEEETKIEKPKIKQKSLSEF